MRKNSKIPPLEIDKLSYNEKGESYFDTEILPFQDIHEFEKASSSASAYTSDQYVILGSTLEKWFGDWHNEPYPLIGIILSGIIETEVSSGKKKRFRKGDLFIGKDINGQGHRTSTLDKENIIAIISLHNHHNKPPTHGS